MNDILGAAIYYTADKTTRRRLFGKDYHPQWVGTKHRFFGGHNYGYLYSYPDKRFANWTREQFEELAKKSTDFGFYLLLMFLIDIISTQGLQKALIVFSVLFLWTEFHSMKWGETSDTEHEYRLLSGSSGVYGGLAGYCVGKYGLFPLTFPAVKPGLVGYSHGNFILWNFVRFWMKDASDAEEDKVKGGNIDHTTHFVGLALGWILSRFI